MCANRAGFIDVEGVEQGLDQIIAQVLKEGVYDVTLRCNLTLTLGSVPTEGLKKGDESFWIIA